MRMKTKQLLKRLLPVIALFLAINIGFGIEYYLRIPKEWYTSATPSGVYNTALTRDFLVDTSEKNAYITAGQELLILDVDNIAIPTLLASFNKTKTATYLAKEGNTLILAGNKDFNVMDVSNPLTPQNKSVFYIHENYSITDVILRNNIVFLSVAADGSSVESPLNKRVLYVVNVSDPINPIEITMIRRPEFYAHELFIEGNILYLAMSDWGVQLFDITNVSNPVAYFPGDFSVFGLVELFPQYVDIRKFEVQIVDGTKYIFIADGDNGYIIGDVSNPVDPETRNGLFIGDVVSLDLSLTHAFVLFRTGQVQVYSLKNPLRFNLMGKFDPYTYTTGGLARDIFVHEATATLYILRTDGLRMFTLVEGVKNDYYREETGLGYTWIAIALSFIICVPLIISALIRHSEKYGYTSKF